MCQACNAEVYCDLALASCADTLALFEDRASCLGARGAWPTGGATSDTAGDSVQCRTTWAVLSGGEEDSPALHCAQAGADSASCVDAPPPPGDVCEEAIPVADLPFEYFGTTTGATDKIGTFEFGLTALAP